jgi:hypothetical protein
MESFSRAGSPATHERSCAAVGSTDACAEPVAAAAIRSASMHEGTGRHAGHLDMCGSSSME